MWKQTHVLALMIVEAETKQSALLNVDRFLPLTGPQIVSLSCSRGAAAEPCSSLSHLTRWLSELVRFIWLKQKLKEKTMTVGKMEDFASIICYYWYNIDVIIDVNQKKLMI